MQGFLNEGWKLSFYALLAYIAYMSLTSLDLVWVNQNLNGELAGAYASLVLLRRIVALLPGVAVTVMFPRIAKTLAEGRLPDRLLVQTAGIILAASSALSFLYFILGDQLIAIIFGKAYQAASPLLGWMGIAMIGVSLSSVWLNYYLAEKPRNFVILLGIAVVLEWFLLNLFPPSMQSAVLAFGTTGWLLTLGGSDPLSFQNREIATAGERRLIMTKSCLISTNSIASITIEMEDFWSRRANAPKYEKTIHVFGQPVLFDSNHAKVLDAASLAEQMYSTWDSSERIDLACPFHRSYSDPEPAPPPERLVDLIHYTGADDWLSIDLRQWGNCFVDMKRGEAHAVLSSSLAENPEQVCQVLVNTILNNFVTRRGYSMLHASALIKDEHILVLQAPHGTGKSTTALRLLLNGYQLLSDSQIYLGEREGALWMGGFPVGRIKLRADMLPLFPAMAAEAKTEPVRNEIKHRVDLMRVDPESAYPADDPNPARGILPAGALG